MLTDVGELVNVLVASGVVGATDRKTVSDEAGKTVSVDEDDCP